MYSEKTAREMLRNSALDTIQRLKDFVEDIDEGDDLFYLSLSIDRIEQEQNLRDILENCADY